MILAKKPNRDIQAALGRSKQSVAAKNMRLGLRNPAGRNLDRRWSPALVALHNNCDLIGRSVAEFLAEARRLNLRGAETLTATAVYLYRARVKFRSRAFYRWTPDREALLRDMVAKKRPMADIALALKQSRSAVKRRMYALKIWRRPYSNRIHWTKDLEVKIAALHRGGASIKFIAESLGLSLSAVYHRARALGLSKTPLQRWAA